MDDASAIFVGSGFAAANCNRECTASVAQPPSGESTATSRDEIERTLTERIRILLLQEAEPMAKLLAERAERGELFGQTEFELRDRVHALGAAALSAAAETSKKRPMSARGATVSAARNSRASRSTARPIG